MIRKDLGRFTVGQESTILEAMRIIDRGVERMAIVLDGDERVAGVVTDGDIRRAILGGVELSAPVGQVANRSPVTVNDDCTDAEIHAALSDRVRFVPVLDAERRLAGVYTLRDRDAFIEIRTRTVAILGMGYVGLTLGLSLADRGFRVYGYDVNPDVARKVRNKQPPFHEKGIQRYLDLHVGRNFAVADELGNPPADIYVISVGTPIDRTTNRPRIEHVCQAAAAIGKVLRGGELVVLRSTVPVGCTRNQVIPALGEHSGLAAGEDFHVAYCPERTAEGRAMEELRTNPQIVGGLNTKSVELAGRLFNEQTQTIIDVGTLEAGEMCKLLDNTYRDVMFAYANQMAMVCERLGLDLCRLTEAVNSGYTRNRIPRPSPGVGGACLSKDPYILMSVFEQHGLEPELLRAARRVNEIGPAQIVERIENMLAGAGKALRGAKVFLLGFAFKGEPETSDLRDSTSLWFLDAIRPKGARLFGADPVVPTEEIEKLGVMAVSVDAGFAEADVAVLLNNHRSYEQLNIHQLLRTMRHPSVLVDCWHVFEPMQIHQIPGVMYASVGY